MAYSEHLSRAMIGWTDETDLKQQIVAIASAAGEPRLDTADDAAVSHTDVNPYGVNTFLQQEVDGWKVDRSMEMLREAGVRWIRQQIPWWDIETLAKGEYVNQYGHNTWEKYDRLVDAAERQGIQILARLDDPPPWARTINTGDHHGPPDDLQDYADFVSTFVSRYKGRIKYFQIWNEPNIYPEWGNRPISARDYVEVLKTGYTAVKQADPDAVVVAASLAATEGMPDGTAENDLAYLQKMYDAGASQYFDILGVQGYGLWSGPGDRRLDRINFSRPRLVRELMVRNGDEAKPMWMTELGWIALPQDWTGNTQWGRVTEEQQASYTVEAYKRAQQEWPWLGVMFYWHFRMAHGDDPNKPMFYWAMLDPDFTPHPVYQSYSEMANKPPVLGIGQHQENDWALEYAGTWYPTTDAAAAARSYVMSTHTGARVSFKFHGTDMDLIAIRTPGAGRLAVTIDGSDSSANKVSVHAAGKAYIDLSAPAVSYQERIPVASGLASRDHQVTLEPADAGRPVFVDAVVVNDQGPDYLKPAIGALAAAVLLAVVGVLLFRGHRTPHSAE